MWSDIWIQIAPAVSQLIVIMLGTLIVMVGTSFKQWAVQQAELLKAKTEQKHREIALTIVTTAVRAVEQLYASGVIESPHKFNQAFLRARDVLEERGLSFSDTELTDLIESATKMLTDTGFEVKRTLLDTEEGYDYADIH